MNKVFKVIGNKNALESKKVVSELASANVTSSDERSYRSDYSIINLADNFKLSLGHMLSIVTLFMITPYLANADIIADANAPTNQQAARRCHVGRGPALRSLRAHVGEGP